MKKIQTIISRSYFLSSILFIGFSFEFFIRSNYVLGLILIIVGTLNLIQFQNKSKRVRRIQIALVAMNLLISYVIADSYALINYTILYLIWSLFLVVYFLIVILQFRLRFLYRKQKKKIRDHFN